MRVDGDLKQSCERTGREKYMNPKYILEAESTIFVNELDGEFEKEGGVENDSPVAGMHI